MGQLGDRAGEIPRDREIFVICRSGARSAQVTVALNQAGWLAKNVDGGMKGWAEAGRPMENGGDGEPYVVQPSSLSIDAFRPILDDALDG